MTPLQALYEVRVEERLDPRWAECMTGLSSLSDGAGGTLLAGILPDQTALHCVLRQLHSLRLTLVSVRRCHVFPKTRRGLS